MNDQLTYTVRAGVGVSRNTCVIGFYLHRASRMIVVYPLPFVRFWFRLAIGPKRDPLEVVSEMMIVISVANVLAFTVAGFLWCISHREEVISLLNTLSTTVLNAVTKLF